MEELGKRSERRDDRNKEDSLGVFDSQITTVGVRPVIYMSKFTEKPSSVRYITLKAISATIGEQVRRK